MRFGMNVLLWSFGCLAVAQKLGAVDDDTTDSWFTKYETTDTDEGQKEKVAPSTKAKCAKECGTTTCAKEKGKAKRTCIKDCKKRTCASSGGVADVDREVEEAAAIEVSLAFKSCRKPATSTYQSCVSDQDVKAKLAEKLDKEAGDISKDQVIRFLKMAARILSPKIKAACKKSGKTKRECNEGVRDDLSVLFKKKQSKTQSMTNVQKGERTEVYEQIQTCISTASTTCDDCVTQAKERLSVLRSVATDKVSKFDIERLYRQVSQQNYGHAMRNCKADADLDDAGKVECRNEARKLIPRPLKDCKTALTTGIREQADRAARQASVASAQELLKERLQTCEEASTDPADSSGGEEQTCDTADLEAKITAELEETSGEAPKKSDVVAAMKQGSLDAILDEHVACVEVKKEETAEGTDVDASECKKEALKKLKRLTAMRRKAFKKKGSDRKPQSSQELRMMLVNRALERKQALCQQLEGEDKTTCEADATEITEAIKALLQGSGQAKTQAQIERSLKKKAREAKEAVASSDLRSCMKLAYKDKKAAKKDGTDFDFKAAKKNCIDGVVASSGNSKGEIKKMLMKGDGAFAVDKLEECVESMSVCMKEIKEEISDPRKLRQIIMFGTRKRLACRRGGCLSEDKTETACDTEIFQLFKNISTLSDKWYEKNLPAIRKISVLEKNGLPTVVKEKPEVDVELTFAPGSKCDDTKVEVLQEELVVKLNGLAETRKPTDRDWQKSDIETSPCEVLTTPTSETEAEEQASYPSKLKLDESDGSDTKNLVADADELAEDLFVAVAPDGTSTGTGGRRLVETLRRLAEIDGVTEVYASQPSEEVSEDEVVTTCDGEVCAFPFTYENVAYTECTTIDGASKCKTESDTWGTCSNCAATTPTEAVPNTTDANSSTTEATTSAPAATTAATTAKPSDKGIIDFALTPRNTFVACLMLVAHAVV